eukprot:403350565
MFSKLFLDRRYVQLELDEDTFKMPLDVKVETLIGFVLTIIGSVCLYISKMRDISFSSQFANKTLEHTHTRKIFRNVQKTRGFIFSSLLKGQDPKQSQLFIPTLQEAMDRNPNLKTLLQ